MANCRHRSPGCPYKIGNTLMYCAECVVDRMQQQNSSSLNQSSKFVAPHYAPGSSSSAQQPPLLSSTPHTAMDIMEANSNNAEAILGGPPIANIKYLTTTPVSATNRNLSTNSNSPYNNKPHKCVECSKSFSRKNDLKRHVDVVHKKIAKFPCTVPNCTHAPFKHNQTLKEHINSAHLQIKPCICEDCGQQFVKNFYLAQHKASVHSGNPSARFRCHLCLQNNITSVFKSQAELSKHHKRSHNIGLANLAFS